MKVSIVTRQLKYDQLLVPGRTRIVNLTETKKPRKTNLEEVYVQRFCETKPEIDPKW